MLTKFFRIAQFFLMSLLAALILLEAGSYGILLVLPNKATFSAQGEDFRKHENWSHETVQFLLEYHQLPKSHFESFVGWRSGEKVTGRILNIDDEGNRITINRSAQGTETVFDFYGGSTIWGYGVSDANTIPSQFARINKNSFARNFGEQGYVSRQELNHLLNNIVQRRIGDVVIFYDGWNDVIHECRHANGPFGDAFSGTARSLVAQIDQKGLVHNLAATIGIRNKIAFTLPNTTTLVEWLTGKRLGRNVYLKLDNDLSDACRDPKVADLVAENLVRNWETAALIAKNNNAKFFAVLQPNLHTSNTAQPYDGVVPAPDDQKKINAVYPLIKKKALAHSWFVDGTAWLDGRSDLFIDTDCHVNENGNEIIAARLFVATDHGQQESPLQAGTNLQ